MPYIEQGRRDTLNPTLYQLIELLQNLGNVGGDLNYVISVLADEYITAKTKRYVNIEQVVGTLECAKLEFYRRVAGPYEDQAINKNGEVYLNLTQEAK